MFLNSNWRHGLDINIGDTFTWGGDADGATIVDIEGDTMFVVWDSVDGWGGDRSAAWHSCKIDEFIETMNSVYVE